MSVLAIDQGTTSTKGYLWRDGAFLPVGSLAQAQILPQPGWVEHDPLEILEHVATMIAQAGPVAALGLANQGETVVAWDAATKRPLHNAIVWQDTRTAGEIERLRAAGVEGLTLERAGLPLDPYFSASKLRWLLDHAEGAGDLLRQGRLRLGTSDAFLLDTLTGVCATDPSTASRTSLAGLRSLQWDADLCEAFGIPIECLPEIRPTIGDFGILPQGMPVVASIVDQQAALFGHGCAARGDIKITFGTGAFALGLTGTQPRFDAGPRLLPTCAWHLGGEAPAYALDGGILTVGAAVNWLRGIGALDDLASLDEFAGPAALERGMAFVPALAGLGCPHWDRDARGAWFGIGLDTSREDLCRAVLEGIAMRAAEVVGALEGALGGPGRIAIDGGVSRSAYFTRFFAAAVGRPVHVATTADVTALGLVDLCLAALGEPARVDADAHRLVQCVNVLPAGLHACFAEAVGLSRQWGGGGRP